MLLDGEIVGVTSYGSTSTCRYVDGYQRVDIRVVQDWLAAFGVQSSAAEIFRGRARLRRDRAVCRPALISLLLRRSRGRTGPG